ncbi:ABC transporter ATP-binding protein [Roseovarius gahaiensis]|uniref:ABC transporter ATP-binding protein n=1 Tax=Roseovarius gahaiensis TaxID=2716691 RepID=A0A967BBM4_9RHOB|nr:ABC transporter ATP-binding protein [Roseovarius gahaiensis]NHQ73086.1 ABC transporter ATP-binding protein [Roseovarius gahaiensis]
MVLAFDAVKKSYVDSDGEVPVLRGVSFELPPGATLALTGESGSGKSTVLHIAGGLEAPSSGRVQLAGQDVTTLNDAGRAALRRNEISLVFQQFNLVPSLTVDANISFQAALSGRVDTGYIERLVAALGLSDQMHKYPEALSGGQQQRVAIARALAAKPKLLLADEPTGNLDEATAEGVLDQMLDLVAETGAALMVVTHSPKIAARMDRELRLQGGVVT